MSEHVTASKLDSPEAQSIALGQASSEPHASPLSGSNGYATPLDLNSLSVQPSLISSVEGPNSLDIFSRLSMPLDPQLSSGMEGVNQDLDEFFTSGFPGSEHFASGTYRQGGSEIADLLMPDDGSLQFTWETSQASYPYAPNHSPISLGGRSLSLCGTESSDMSGSPCSCLMQVFCMMKRLTMSKSAASALANGIYESLPPGELSSVSSLKARAVVVDNQQIIGLASGVLRCSCSESNHMLTMLSMIVVMLLGSYAVAAPESLDTTEQPSIKTGRDASVPEPSGAVFGNHKETDRIVAQLIFSELHRVQQLVDAISTRLTTRENAAGRQILLSPESGTIAPHFSATTLDRIGMDMRESLSRLSSKIISILGEV
ncbi:putative Zn(2)-C6 fungal-type domain-containing protein [Seiridium cardinale]